MTRLRIDSHKHKLGSPSLCLCVFGEGAGLEVSADLALFHAKHNGRGQYVVFDPERDGNWCERLDLEAQLRGAVGRNKFRLRFQPIVSLTDERLAVDDFGMVYSSLSNLTRMPVDILKVDRSFVGRMLDSERVASVVRRFRWLTRWICGWWPRV